ncbi:MAG: hypothetical protein ABUL44_01315 [Flavobacterium sp.]
MKKYKEAYLAGLVIIILIIYSVVKLHTIEMNGVVTICKIDRYEPLPDGSNTYCTVFLNGRQYEIISGLGSSRMVGKFYFVKILKEDPTVDAIVYNEKEVPKCILQGPLPLDGWDQIPTCN